MVEALKKILIKINRLPFPLTINHYYAFGGIINLLKDKKNDSMESWEALRVGHPHFSISENREEWLRACELKIKKDGQDSNLIKRAQDIVKILDSLKIETVFSVGVGGGALEYQIKKIKPQLKLICSEYTKLNVDLLKKVFLECDSIVLFDVTNKDWSAALQNVKAKYQLCLINRVDTSLTDVQWKDIFKNLFDSGIQNVLYIPTNFLTIWSFFIRMSRRFYQKINHQLISFAGYLRTKKTFQNYWRFLYDEEEMDLGGLEGFLLKKIKK